MNAQIVTMTNNMTEEQWLEARRSGIGGSDAAAVLGISPFSSPMEIYLDKIGELPAEKKDNEAIYWGNIHEDIVAQEFTRRTGYKVRRRNAILQHPDYPFMRADVDRLVVGHKWGLECKNTGEFQKDEWVDDIVPDHYFIQCQHYMAVTGYPFWWIAVLIGGNKFVYKKLERDEELIQGLIEMEEDFWHNHVLAKNPPAWDGSKSSTELMKKMYPENDHFSLLYLPDDADKWLIQLQDAKALQKDAEKRKNEAENQLKDMMETAEQAKIGDTIITWKSQKTNRFDTTAFKEQHPELYKQFVVTGSSRPLRTKVLKPKKSKKAKSQKAPQKEAK